MAGGLTPPPASPNTRASLSDGQEERRGRGRKTGCRYRRHVHRRRSRIGREAVERQDPDHAGGARARRHRCVAAGWREAELDWRHPTGAPSGAPRHSNTSVANGPPASRQALGLANQAGATCPITCTGKSASGHESTARFGNSTSISRLSGLRTLGFVMITGGTGPTSVRLRHVR